ncbi:MAG: CRISPR-associated helicase Cas3' [Candidatus Aenigmatarchaeota archaeon]
MKEINDEWEDLLKESHPNKPLQVHINEVENIFSTFLKFYSFPKEIENALEYIVKYHDFGKLHKMWNIRNEKNPDHAPLSVKYLMEYKVLPEDKKITFVLWYLIYKHHSPLTKNIKGIAMQYLVEEVKEIIKTLDFNYITNLIDAFGLFKIADVCSAENKSIELKKPAVCDEDVKNILKNNKSNFQLDIDRWLEQQQLCNLQSPGVLRAYTGWGKTDVSLLFFKNKDVSKIFYLFPTITAINKFYQKLQNVFGRNVIKYFYFYDTEVKEDLDLLQNMFFIENFIKPFVITTVDQFLLSFLQVGKYYTKRVMFRNSGIVLDEVHLLNPLMLSLLTYFLKKFQNIYSFKVLFMSATLSKGLEKYLASELNLTQNSFLDFSYGYKAKRRALFEYLDEDLDLHIDDIVKNFKDGKKVIVVVNTVEKSIEIAEKLVKEVGKENVLLLHARFMYKDRKRKEDEIEKLKEKPHILITTQVCEVSLDVSYDFMFTELAPLPSLIQRFGRVNRRGVKTEEVNVKIFKPKIENERYYPYTSDELCIAKKIVEELSNNLKSEFDLLKNLDEIYTYDKLLEILQRETKKVNLEQFEELLQFFFSLDISEEELAKILSYRDSFTTLIIPSPECVEDEEVKKCIEELLCQDFKNKNFNERRKLLAEFKEVSVPVPIWWVRKYLRDEERKALPIVDLKDKIYNSFYGFREVGSEII